MKKEKPVKKKWKIDLKKRLFDKAYIAEIERLEKEEGGSCKKNITKRTKSKRIKNKNKDESDDDSDKVFEEEEDFITKESKCEEEFDEVENDWDPIEMSFINTWKSISSPTAGSELLGKWFGAIYKANKKKQSKYWKSTKSIL